MSRCLTLSLPAVLLCSAATGQPRYFVNSAYNPWGWWADSKVFEAYVDVSKARGHNAMTVDISWAAERPDGSYDFSLLDSQVNCILSRNMSAFVRLNLSTIANKVPYWFTDEHLMCQPDGSVYRHAHGGTIPSISCPLVIEKMVRFAGAVARHCDRAFPLRASGAETILGLSVSFTPTLECEYFFDGEIDYSTWARADFARWVRREYASLADLNGKWGTHYTRWDEAGLVSAHPTAKELFFESNLRDLLDRIGDAVRSASPRIKVGMQTGCIWDVFKRRVMNVTPLLRKMDWIYVADAPSYPHAFSTDYLRCSAPGKLISNEIDGPWTGGTDEQWTDQAIQTYAHGANALFTANWSMDDMRDAGKWTFRRVARRLAHEPAVKPKPDVAIYLSTWDLIHQKIGVGTYQQAYNELSSNGLNAVDVLPDAVIAAGPDALARYQRVYLPANVIIPPEVRSALLRYRGRLVIAQPDRAGTMDVYLKPTARL